MHSCQIHTYYKFPFCLFIFMGWKAKFAGDWGSWKAWVEWLVTSQSYLIWCTIIQLKPGLHVYAILVEPCEFSWICVKPLQLLKCCQLGTPEYYDIWNGGGRLIYRGIIKQDKQQQYKNTQQCNGFSQNDNIHCNLSFVIYLYLYI